MKPILILQFCLTLLFFVSPGLAQDEYRLDDGVKESSWGVSSAGTGAVSFAWLNQFVVETDKENITAVNLAFGHPDPTFGGSVANGTPVTVYVWYDLFQDGDPASSVVVAHGSGFVENTGTNTFTSYNLIQPVTLSVGDSFFAGAIIDNLTNPPPPSFVHVGSLDEDGTDATPFYPPNRHSWVAASNDGIPVNPDALGAATLSVDRVENALPLPTCVLCSGDGNWLIRLNASSASGPGAPILTISPPILDFGPSSTIESSPNEFITLFNTGTGLLQISAISPPGPGSRFLGPNPFLPNACGTPPFTISSGGNCRLYYAFNPLDTIAYFDSITVDSNTTATPPPPVELRGEGVDVFVGLAQPLVDFGDVQVGSTAVGRLTILNLDNGHPSGLGFPFRVDNLDSLAHGGLPPFLTVEPGTCGSFPFHVDYLASCELEFRFTPPGPGPFGHPDEIFTNGATGVTQFIVEGNGVPSAPPQLAIEPPPDPVSGESLLDFGTILQGTPSAPLPARLTNTGGSDLDFSIATTVISFLFTIDLGDCGTNIASMTLLAGQSCELLFGMTPTTGHLGPYSHLVTLLSNAGSTPDLIRLIGEVAELPLFRDRFEELP